TDVVSEGGQVGEAADSPVATAAQAVHRLEDAEPAPRRRARARRRDEQRRGPVEVDVVVAGRQLKCLQVEGMLAPPTVSAHLGRADDDVIEREPTDGALLVAQGQLRLRR